MIQKKFIVFEGIDGAGTSTQISELKKRPETKDFFFTAEPTGGATGKFLRQMLKGDVKLDPRTAAYLFAADRCEHLYGSDDDNAGICKKCDSGRVCVSDRYIFSSLAYQAVGCGEELPKILNSTFPLPEILFFFEIEPEVSLGRIGGRDFREIYEQEEFLKTTERLYKKFIAEYEEKFPEMNVVRIDATKSREEISEIIWEEISKII